MTWSIAIAAAAVLLQTGLQVTTSEKPRKLETSAGTSPWVDAALAERIATDQQRSFADRRRSLIYDIRTRVRAADSKADDGDLERVLYTIGSVPRERFVAPEAMQLAYLPTPLNIGYGQTISDAYVMAIMIAELRLRPDANVLDIGTGSGYQAAVLARLARRVSSIEIVKPLADAAVLRLRRLNYRNVEVRAGDGFAGWPEHAPFDGIVVAAGAAQVPQPLIAQLKPGGRLVMPIGPTEPQEQLLVLTKLRDGSVKRCSLGQRRFVPLIGAGARRAEARARAGGSVRRCHAADVI